MNKQVFNRSGKTVELNKENYLHHEGDETKTYSSGQMVDLNETEYLRHGKDKNLQSNEEVAVDRFVWIFTDLKLE